MTPSLAQQIEAVEWAAENIVTTDQIRAALKAALETLRHLQFFREVLN